MTGCSPSMRGVGFAPLSCGITTDVRFALFSRTEKRVGEGGDSGEALHFDFTTEVRCSLFDLEPKTQIGLRLLLWQMRLVDTAVLWPVTGPDRVGHHQRWILSHDSLNLTLVSCPMTCGQARPRPLSLMSL